MQHQYKYWENDITEKQRKATRYRRNKASGRQENEQNSIITESFGMIPAKCVRVSAHHWEMTNACISCRQILKPMHFIRE